MTSTQLSGFWTPSPLVYILARSYNNLLEQPCREPGTKRTLPRPNLEWSFNETIDEDTQYCKSVLRVAYVYCDLCSYVASAQPDSAKRWWGRWEGWVEDIDFLFYVFIWYFRYILEPSQPTPRYCFANPLILVRRWDNIAGLAIRGHPFITFAKFSGFWTPSPLVRFLGWIIRLNSRNLAYYVRFWVPSPLPLSANVINGSPLTKYEAW